MTNYGGSQKPIIPRSYLAGACQAVRNRMTEGIYDLGERVVGHPHTATALESIWMSGDYFAGLGHRRRREGPEKIGRVLTEI